MKNLMSAQRLGIFTQDALCVLFGVQRKLWIYKKRVHAQVGTPGKAVWKLSVH